MISKAFVENLTPFNIGVEISADIRHYKRCTEENFFKNIPILSKTKTETPLSYDFA